MKKPKDSQIEKKLEEILLLNFGLTLSSIQLDLGGKIKEAIPQILALFDSQKKLDPTITEGEMMLAPNDLHSPFYTPGDDSKPGWRGFEDLGKKEEARPKYVGMLFGTPVYSWEKMPEGKIYFSLPGEGWEKVGEKKLDDPTITEDEKRKIIGNVVEEANADQRETVRKAGEVGEVKGCLHCSDGTVGCRDCGDRCRFCNRVTNHKPSPVSEEAKPASPQPKRYIVLWRVRGEKNGHWDIAQSFGGAQKVVRGVSRHYRDQGLKLDCYELDKRVEVKSELTLETDYQLKPKEKE